MDKTKLLLLMVVVVTVSQVTSRPVSLIFNCFIFPSTVHDGRVVIFAKQA